MFQIGEFSKLTHVSIRMLRHYDEIGILHPAMIDEESGYRMYSVDQLKTLQKIVLLRDAKFLTSEIAVALSHWDDEFIIQELQRKKKELEKLIQEDQMRMQKVCLAIKDIENKTIDVHYNVLFKQIPSYKMITLREKIPSYYHEGALWCRLFQYLEQQHIAYIRQPGCNIAFYHDEGYRTKDVDVEVGVMVKKLGEDKDGFTYRESEAIELAACSMVYGPYQNIDAAYRSFAYWLDQNPQYRMKGVNRQICHVGQENERDPQKYLTELQIPVAKVYK